MEQWNLQWSSDFSSSLPLILSSAFVYLSLLSDYSLECVAWYWNAMAQETLPHTRL